MRKPFIQIKETWRAFIPNQEIKRTFILIKETWRAFIPNQEKKEGIYSYERNKEDIYFKSNYSNKGNKEGIYSN